MTRFGVCPGGSITVCSIVFIFMLMCHSAAVGAGDSCVTCHTDEEMLINNLGKDVKQKSSLQSGPG